jgi:hypothetical protein
VVLIPGIDMLIPELLLLVVLVPFSELPMFIPLVALDPFA